MKKAKLIEKLVDLVKSKEMTVEQIKKAMTSMSITGKTDLELEKEAQEAAETEAANEKAKEIKLAPGLFKEVSLGSTLKQSSTGNVMSNVKQSNQDYVANGSKIRNVKYTSKE